VQEGPFPLARPRPVGSATSVDALLAQIRHEETPWLEKRRLVKQTYRAIYQARQMEIAEALRVKEAQTHANANAALAAIRVEEERTRLEIRNTYLQILTDIGVRVELEQLRLITDVGEKLTIHKKGLADRDLDDAYKQMIVSMADKSFQRLFHTLDELTDDLFTKAKDRGLGHS
jgi:hypothetical protein